MFFKHGNFAKCTFCKNREKSFWIFLQELKPTSFFKTGLNLNAQAILTCSIFTLALFLLYVGTSTYVPTNGHLTAANVVITIFGDFDRKLAIFLRKGIYKMKKSTPDVGNRIII
jgi:hypothetical protein